MKTYKELEDAFYVRIEEEDIVAATAAVASGKLRQVANGALYTEAPKYLELHDKKLEALESLLEELNGHSVLVLYDFRHDADRINARIRGATDLSKLSGKELDRAIDRFNSAELSVVLGHPASMGHGLNLQGSCHHIIWFGIPWNLEYYDQAVARVYRQGQKATQVHVYHIVAENTMDERVVRVLKKKDWTQQELLRSLTQPLDL